MVNVFLLTQPLRAKYGRNTALPRRLWQFAMEKARNPSFAPSTLVTLSHKPGRVHVSMKRQSCAVYLSYRIIPRKTASHFCWKCSVCLTALSYAKPLRTFAGNAPFVLPHYPTQNRFTLLLEMLRLSYRIILRKTASHFCWKCSIQAAATRPDRTQSSASGSGARCGPSDRW
ncbi:hypothetical protein FHS76_002777 [Ochrobactrum daejeonense]|uniref:Uncharacterized protein n=1 Tax=Brucella daejeonensis TaxID=659015 RepID=A0A7W9ENN2_9HYPH|nr:hypothetical protein [Brucella daejeonensis]